jgi:hypothetical protein
LQLLQQSLNGGSPLPQTTAALNRIKRLPVFSECIHIMEIRLGRAAGRATLKTCPKTPGVVFDIMEKARLGLLHQLTLHPPFLSIKSVPGFACCICIPPAHRISQSLVLS